MKRSHYMMVTLLISGVLLASGMALSSEGSHGKEKDLLTVKLSMEEAIATAKTKFPGQVLEAELENEEGKAVYEIEIANSTGTVKEIKVDAQSGELLNSDIDEEYAHEQEESGEKTHD